MLQETSTILTERFGRDSLLALATAADGMPYVRTVNAYYEDGAFYVITHALSGKMRQIAKNPCIALCGDWFTANGRGESLGWFGRAENAQIAGKLREAFASWIGNGHNNFEDENTIILKLSLTSAVLFSHGTRYDIDFTA